jgi:hypothetical protein
MAAQERVETSVNGPLIVCPLNARNWILVEAFAFDTPCSRTDAMRRSRVLPLRQFAIYWFGGTETVARINAVKKAV